LYVLEKVLAERELDFCLLCSSLSSLFGGLEFGAYTAANLFMDVFTNLHNRRCPQWWTSVNWDAWGIEQEGVDLSARGLMLPSEGGSAFERIVANGPMTQVVHSVSDLETRIKQYARMVAADAVLTDGSLHPRPALETPYVAPTNEVEESVAEIWQNILGIKPIGIHDNFLALGGHSLIATQIISRLRQTFQVYLPLSLLFMVPTIAELAIAIEMAIIEELEGIEKEGPWPV
jgi:acyl carrier protein